MKILNNGDPTMLLKPKKFLCTKCGCLFEADNTEYNYGTQREPDCWCKCPVCGKTVDEWR